MATDPAPAAGPARLLIPGLRVLGAAGMAAGGVTWAVTLIRFGLEHPWPGHPLWGWPPIAAAVVGAGALLALAGRWSALRSPARAGAVIAGAGLAGIVPTVSLLAILPFLAGSLVIGSGLAVRPATRIAGVLLAASSVLFVVTRAWTMGPAGADVGPALSPSEIVESALALALGGGWTLAAIACLRDR